jgi:hypothetical protein
MVNRVERHRPPNPPTHLAVPVGLRHAKVAPDVLLGVAPLLVPDKHERDAVDAADAAYHRGVVEPRPVAVQLDELVRDVEDDVQGRWAVGVARDLQALDGGQARVGLFAELWACWERGGVLDFLAGA